MIRLTQGDSYATVVTCSTDPAFPTGWTGKWAIVPAAGGLPLCSGNMTVSPGGGALLATLPAGATSATPPGDYVWAEEVSNPTISFRREIKQDALQLRQQMIAD